MISQQVLDYTKQQKQQGISDKDIKGLLTLQGWQAQDVDEAFYLTSNLGSTPTSPSSTNSPIPATDIKPAGAWGRFWAFFIDGLVFGIFGIFIVFLLAAISGSPVSFRGSVIDNIGNHPSLSIAGLLFIPLYLFYFTYFTFKKGATAGKEAYGFRVVTYKTTQPVSLGQAIKREIFKVLYFIPLLGNLLYIIVGLGIIFSHDKRGLPDHLAGTQVVRAKKAWPLGKQFLYLLILILLIVGVFGFGGLADKFINPNRPRTEFTISSNPTGTITNEVDGWLVKYDSDKFSRPYIPSKEYREKYSSGKLYENKIEFRRKTGGTVFCIDSFTIDTKDNPNNLPLDTWKATNENTILARGTAETIVVNGVSGLKVVDITDSNASSGKGTYFYKTKWVSYLIPSSNKVFVLQYLRPMGSPEYAEDECQRNEEALNKTFETFRIL